MIEPLVRLPAMLLDHDALDALVECVEVAGQGRTVLLGDQRGVSGGQLDAFVVATAVRARGTAAGLGIAATVGAGRMASLVAREATAAQLLGACDVLLLEGSTPECRDAARVIGALFTEGAHTVTTRTESIVEARNRPLPDVVGGPPVYWCEGDDVVQLVDGDVAPCGRVIAATLPLPAPAPGALVVAEHDLDTPMALAAALSR
jgi:hypothetical protein